MKTAKMTIQQALSLSLFKDILDEGELMQLGQRFGDADARYARLDIGQPFFSQWREKLEDRRGEIVLVVQNDEKRVLLHTKSFYPDGAFRLLTGGIKYGEPVLEALERETFEETGFKIISARLLSISFFEFLNKKKSVPFVSYIFLIASDRSNPEIQDVHERISGFRWVPLEQLEDTANLLQKLSGKWKDWGIFRAIPHEIAAEKLLT
jgi:8-oxo-dGTP pyrophosphatase MutT (NUDIX family)